MLGSLRVGPVLLALLILFSLVACEEDERNRETVFAGTVIFVEDESPMDDLEVTLFDPVTLTSIDQDITDTDGYFEFRGIPAGKFTPVVHANGFEPVFLPKSSWIVVDRQRIEVEIRMKRAVKVGSSNFTMQGILKDRETDELIRNARLEINFPPRTGSSQVNWSEFLGRANTLEATTDAEGYFRLGPLPTIQDPTTGLLYVPETRMVAKGYRSRSTGRDYDPKTTSASTRIFALTPGEDQGAIEGTVVDSHGHPHAGIPVSCEWRSSETDNFFRAGFEKEDDAPDQRILIPEAVGWTDEQGHFRISGLPEGRYNVMAGPFPDDGWVGPMLNGVIVKGFAGVGNAKLTVTAALEGIFPDDGAVFPSGPPDRIEWEADENAVSYVLSLTRSTDGGEVFAILSTSFLELDSGGGGFLPLTGSIAWKVQALDRDGQPIRESDGLRVFHYDQPPDLAVRFH